MEEFCVGSPAGHFVGKPGFQSKRLVRGEFSSGVDLVVISGLPQSSCRPFRRQGVGW